MLKNLLMWFLLKTQKPLSAKESKTTKVAVLIEELGDLQVFHLLKEHEMVAKDTIIPYEVYWQSKSNKQTYGPFMNTYSAYWHHTELLKGRNRMKPTKPPGMVIEVDFKTKKRKQ